MKFLDSQWPKHAFQFGGGGSFLDPLGLFKKKPDAAAGIKSAPVPLPAAPIAKDDPAVVQAEHDLARESLGKKSIKKTIFAGDNGGYGAGSGAPGSPAPKGKF